MAFQSWNSRSKRWVKFSDNGAILNVKEKEPQKPFAGVKIKKGKKKM